MTDPLKLFDDWLATPAPIPACANEAAFAALWHERQLNLLEPVATAVAGALMADRLAWVFAAGYQATLRNAFPTLPGAGWAAFVATEEPQPSAQYPGTCLEPGSDGLLLSGYKLWVAHSALVKHLIVTINDSNGDKYKARAVIINSERPGVVLSHRKAPGFLPALSQGYAQFTNVAVTAGEVIEFEAIRQFGRTEAKFVMLASLAFMFARADNNTPFSDRILSTAAALISMLQQKETSRRVYAALDREFQQLVSQFEDAVDTSVIADYSNDSRLFRMYSARIQRKSMRA